MSVLIGMIMSCTANNGFMCEYDIELMSGGVLKKGVMMCFKNDDLCSKLYGICIMYLETDNLYSYLYQIYCKWNRAMWYRSILCT